MVQDLGTLGGDSGIANGISANGLVVAGEALNNLGYDRAFRWQNNAMQNLGTLGGSTSYGYSVSADGTTVVGQSRDYAGFLIAFLWTQPTGMVAVGTVGGTQSAANGVSADGSIVVGWSYNNNQMYSAFRRRRNHPIEDLNITYAALLTNGSMLWSANAISPDGRYIVGWGYNATAAREEAFLLDTGFPLRGDVDRNGCVEDADLLRVLFEFGRQGYRNEDLNWDGTVDDADLLTVLFNFGSGC
jgi:probable HAF family extracellular repeat protein